MAKIKEKWCEQNTDTESEILSLKKKLLKRKFPVSEGQYENDIDFNEAFAKIAATQNIIEKQSSINTTDNLNLSLNSTESFSSNNNSFDTVSSVSENLTPIGFTSASNAPLKIIPSDITTTSINKSSVDNATIVNVPTTTVNVIPSATAVITDVDVCGSNSLPCYQDINTTSTSPKRQNAFRIEIDDSNTILSEILMNEIKSLRNEISVIDNKLNTNNELIMELIKVTKKNSFDKLKIINTDENFELPTLPMTTTIDIYNFNKNLLNETFLDQMVMIMIFSYISNDLYLFIF